MTDTITIDDYEKHVLLCCGKHCDANRDVMMYLKQRLQDSGLSSRVRANRAGCLGVCVDGPIMVIYPEGVWYRAVDTQAIDRIIEQHLLHDQWVDDLLIHVMGQTS